MRRKSVLMWVAPEFKTKIKLEAAELNMPILDYTSQLVRKNNQEHKEENPKIKRRFTLDF